ncbi:hypothetical protein BCR36DRAFT_373568 [Piromyces finnis]|uniref:MARVEL domain-containing protein n=1 Tax=Piromyces finnis TaxID=1754191 RepID=A0A1Y1UZI4_9FUNG|nr:hypothetical protein BCR36DRAFT_373568 [Piromyces finnis]|eukprot:ORX43915.1 hypothetical protein BCR36DRAFT_373568 [Piromyces finnis]
MGFFDKCICCPCLSKEQSVKVCTYVFTALEILSFIISIGNGSFRQVISSLLSIAVIASFIYLLYAMKTGNPKYLNQIKLIFGIVLALEVLNFIIYIFAAIILFFKAGNRIVQLNYAGNDFKNFFKSSKELETEIRTYAALKIIGYLVGVFLVVNYYLSTINYINELLKTLEVENSARKEESGIKEETTKKEETIKKEETTEKDITA